MRTIWFIADPHFWHTNVIRHDNRPFESVVQMNEEMIVLWNEFVHPNDEVWLLGDFVYRCPDPVAYYCSEILKRLNGKINIVWGNHDKYYAKKIADQFHACFDMTRIRYNKVQIILCHYALMTWEFCHMGSTHIHGHSHGMLPIRRNCLDVGCMNQGYRPISFEEVMSKIAQQNDLIDNLDERHPEICYECLGRGLVAVPDGNIALGWCVCDNCAGDGTHDPQAKCPDGHHEPGCVECDQCEGDGKTREEYTRPGQEHCLKCGGIGRLGVLKKEG